MRSLKQKAARLAALTITAAAGATVSLVVPAAAHAATLPAAAACQFHSGTTSTFVNGKPTSGTQFTKPRAGTTSCRDLNLRKVNATDSYKGVLHWNNGWRGCKAGFRKFSPGQPGWVVLCTDVKPNTLMRVQSQSGKTRTITIMD